MFSTGNEMNEISTGKNFILMLAREIQYSPPSFHKNK